MIVLGVKLIDSTGLKGGVRTIGRIQRDALRSTAEFWHQVILARHFSPGAAAGYHHEQRSRVYKQIIKPKEGSGPGKYVDLLLKGRSRRAMQYLYTITGSKDRMTLRMQTPKYFTNPYIGTFKDPRTGKAKRITRQPDKVKEVTTIGSGDRQILRDHFADQLLAGWQRAPKTSTTTTITP